MPGKLIKRRGIFYVSWTEGRRSKRLSTGSRSREEAEKFLAGFLLDRNELPKGKALTLSQAIEKYLEDHKKSVKNISKERSFTIPLLRFFPENINEIDKSLCNAYCVKRRKELKSISNGTLRRELAVLSAALNHAKQDGLLHDVPIITLPSPPPPRERWLTKEEASKLLKACEQSFHLWLFCQIALNTGARPGSILDLTWFQVDLVNRRISFLPEGQVQTNKQRAVVPINDTILSILTEAKKNADSSYVISWRGKQVKEIKTAFRKAIKRAGLKDVIPYTLRHTAATWMAQAGVPLVTIGGILGQSIQRTTERYIKHHPDYLKQGVTALDIIGAQLARNDMNAQENPCVSMGAHGKREKGKSKEKR